MTCVISKMSNARTTGLDEILMEFWKSTDNAGTEWLTSLFNVILKTTKMPEEWRWGTMVLLTMNKGNIQNCNNYRGIKLLSILSLGESGGDESEEVCLFSRTSLDSCWGDLLQKRGD